MERIIVMVKNEVGVIADITGLLADAGHQHIDHGHRECR